MTERRFFTRFVHFVYKRVEFYKSNFINIGGKKAKRNKYQYFYEYIPCLATSVWTREVTCVRTFGIICFILEIR